MANLWKDGDVITAEGLNRFVVANLLTIESVTRLDITPADVFDDSNKLLGLIVINMVAADSNGTECYYLFVIGSYYSAANDTYELQAFDPQDSSSHMYVANGRTDYFVPQSNNDNTSE